MSELLTFASGRRVKWIVAVVWVLRFHGGERRRAPDEVHRRAGERVDVVPARRRGVDEGPSSRRGAPGRRERRGRRRLPARQRADRRRPGGHGGGPRELQRGPAALHPAALRAGAVQGRHDGADERGDHRRRRERHDPRSRRPAARGGVRPRRRPAGQGHRSRRLRRRRDQGLREHQRHPAAGRRLAGDRAADPDLPQPDLLADPARRGGVRRGHGAGARLRADRAGRHGQRPVVLDPVRARPRARGPTTRCCWCRATARSCASTTTSTRRWRWRSAPPGRRSSPPA